MTVIFIPSSSVRNTLFDRRSIPSLHKPFFSATTRAVCTPPNRLIIRLISHSQNRTLYVSLSATYFPRTPLSNQVVVHRRPQCRLETGTILTLQQKHRRTGGGDRNQDPWTTARLGPIVRQQECRIWQKSPKLATLIMDRLSKVDAEAGRGAHRRGNTS
jgi:hypothetical protein